MFCKHCGKELNNEAVMCVNCGTVVDDEFFKRNAAPAVVQPTAAGQSTRTESKKTNGFAIAGFVLSFFGLFSWICALLGLIFSIIGLVSSKRTNSGKGLAIAGIVISACGFIISITLTILILPYIVKALATLFVVLLMLIIV